MIVHTWKLIINNELMFMDEIFSCFNQPSKLYCQSMQGSNSLSLPLLCVCFLVACEKLKLINCLVLRCLFCWGNEKYRFFLSVAFRSRKVKKDEFSSMNKVLNYLDYQMKKNKLYIYIYIIFFKFDLKIFRRSSMSTNNWTTKTLPSTIQIHKRKYKCDNFLIMASSKLMLACFGI